MTGKLYIVPQSTGYAPQKDGSEVSRVALDGGPGEYTSDFDDSSAYTQINWLTTSEGYDLLCAFFRNRTVYGKDPFLINLPVEGSDIVEQTAYFIPASLKLTGKRGDAFYVSAQIEILPLAEDAEWDSSIVDVWEASGGDPEGYLNGFWPIVHAAP